MTRDRNQYTAEFKRDAVQLTETSDKTVAQIARELGIKVNNLYRWRKQFRQSIGSNGRTMAEMETELNRLRQENRVLRQERDVLKKAINILGQEQR
jgi:transposase